MGSGVNPSCVEFVEHCFLVLDGLVDEFLCNTCSKENGFELLLFVVENSLEEPIHFVYFVVRLRNDSLLVCEIGEDCITLVFNGAIVFNPYGKLVASTIGACGLNSCPILKWDANIFKFHIITLK